MKDVNVTVTAKASKIIGGVVLVGLIAAVGFLYYELSQIREDLYAVRTDYYGLGSSDETGKYNSQVDYQLVSQTVKEVRYVDNEAMPVYAEDGSYEQTYKTAKLRVLEVKITNNADYAYSYYPGAIGAIVKDGQIDRGVTPHTDDDMNTHKAGVELAPGGTATVYVYILDTGTEVEKLYNTDTSTEIAV